MKGKNNEVRKLLNEMSKEELVDCIISNNAGFYISKDGGVSTARHYLITALLSRSKKIEKIDTGDITKAKTRKEILDIIAADERKQKRWDSIHKRVDELLKMK